MSRRRRNWDHKQVILDVECVKGHRVGRLIKRGPDYPDPNPYLVEAPLYFEENHADPSPTSGKVRCICDQCGADVQITWLRALDELDSHEFHGRHTGTIRATAGQ